MSIAQQINVQGTQVTCRVSGDFKKMLANFVALMF